MHIAGEELVARADRSLAWPAQRTLFVADLHLGKGCAFRAEGRPIPEGTTAETLSRLHDAVAETGVERLVILGDLWHDLKGRDQGTRERFDHWLRDHRQLAVSLIVGNHDARSGDLNQGHLCIEAEGVLDFPFVYTHHPTTDPAGYVLSGHLHPAARVSGRGRQSYVLPCFWFRKGCGVLPSFGAMTGSWTVSCGPEDLVYVIAEGKVLAV